MPRSERVAERAGISMATLFRYFDTLDDLRQAASRRVTQRFPDLLVIPDMGRGPLAERIATFVALRVQLWETIHPLVRLGRSHAFHDARVAAMVDEGRRLMAGQIRQQFDPELRTLTAAQRDNAIVTIASLTSVESWEQFRRAFGRSALQTRRAWGEALERILAVRG